MTETPVGVRLRECLDVVAALKQRQPLTIIETGTIRNPADEAGDGHSTLHMAKWIEDRIKSGITGDALFSIELVHGHVRESREFLGPLADLVEYMLGDSVLVLEHFGEPIDFAYLDSCADPEHNLHEFRRVQKYMRSPGLAVIDDTFDTRTACKGLLTMPIAKLQGFDIGAIANRLGVTSFGIPPKLLEENISDFTRNPDLDYERVNR
jgi:predicted O-methyltransferase YrrM